MVNMTNISGIDSFQSLAYFTNNSVDGILFSGGIVVLFFIMLMVLNKNGEPFINSFTVSSWSIFIISVLLWYAELVPIIFVLGFLTCTAFGTLMLYAGGR